MDGLLPNQQFWGADCYISFQENGPMGKDWIYGSFLTEDSLARCAAYRKGGKWVPLPLSFGNPVSRAYDMLMYGDTLYLCGFFGMVKKDGDTNTIKNAAILKWHNDSLWAGDPGCRDPMDMSVKGDSLLIAGCIVDSLMANFVFNRITTDGVNWSPAFSIVHPTDSFSSFGAHVKMEFLPNGDVLALNSNSPDSNAYNGIARWDGQQWHSYGQGIFRGNSIDFEFYRNELYMGGAFAKYYITGLGDTTHIELNNPGNSIARWDGQQWNEVGNGIRGSAVNEMFVYDSLLFCYIGEGNPQFQLAGDANIPFLAAWNGRQWCGTPTTYGVIAPASFGYVDDTLYVSFRDKGTINGQSMSFMAYYDGDYVHGPDAICSTAGLGIVKKPAHENFQLYPVPARNYLKLTTSANYKSIRYQISNFQGKILKDNTIDLSSEAAIDISKLPVGMYHLLLLTDESSQAVVFIKE